MGTRPMVAGWVQLGKKNFPIISTLTVPPVVNREMPYVRTAQGDLRHPPDPALVIAIVVTTANTPIAKSRLRVIRVLCSARATCFSFLSFIREEREIKCICSLWRGRSHTYVTNLSSSHVEIVYVEIITIRFFFFDSCSNFYNYYCSFFFKLQ
jgi:hypothetical protein